MTPSSSSSCPSRTRERAAHESHEPRSPFPKSQAIKTSHNQPKPSRGSLLCDRVCQRMFTLRSRSREPRHVAGHLRTHLQFAKSLDVGRHVLTESNGARIHSGTGSSHAHFSKGVTRGHGIIKARAAAEATGTSMAASTSREWRAASVSTGWCPAMRARIPRLPLPFWPRPDVG